MILEKETFKKFGYHPNDLKPHSHKKILAKCDECGKIRAICKGSSFELCRSCAKKGEKNPLYGKKGKDSHCFGKHLSEETKQKISDNHADFRGKNSSFYGKHHTKETKEKISRTRKENGLSVGAFNPNWRGGTSFEPYCILFNEEFRERVREFWDRKCVICGKTETEQMNEMKNNGKVPFRLSVHHVTYDKDTCCDDSAPLFVALCVSHHSKTNFNEEYWQNEIKRIIYSKSIDGKCFYTKEETENERKNND